jgi:hypothetical protein
VKLVKGSDRKERVVWTVFSSLLHPALDLFSRLNSERYENVLGYFMHNTISHFNIVRETNQN